MIQWLAVWVVFATTPETVEVKIYRQGEQFIEHGDCLKSNHTKNEKFFATVDERVGTITVPEWVCIPVWIPKT